ncbi:trypsin-like serine protease [Streptomyces sp. NPDC051907]|uniref:trypsin-like serine protease n=1 Tax=Streptomyces sp. NPDC051907 TaxID=3155284 RepID=UPI00341D17F1
MQGIRSRSAWAGLMAVIVAAGALNSPLAQAMDGDAAAAAEYRFAAKIDVGGVRACTGTLINNQWVMTASSCFAENPGEALAAGAPKRKSTVVVGRTDLTTTAGEERQIVELAPRQDRDLVLAKLSAPVHGIRPLRPASTAPVADEKLKGVGFGRTKSVWVPNTAHAASFTAGQVRDTEVLVDGSPVCKGDAGSPVFRETGGRLELAAVVSKSTHGGCLGSEETRTGASAVRVDDLGTWIRQTTAATLSTWKTQMLTKTDTGLHHAIRDSNGDWSGFGDVQKVAGTIEDLAFVANAANYGKNYVFAVGGNGRLYEANRRPTGGWAGFRDISDELGHKPGLKTVAVTSMGKSLGLIGLADGRVYHAIQGPDEKWSKWGDVTAKLGVLGNATQLTISQTSGGDTHVGVVADKKAYHAIRYEDGTWSKWGRISSLPTGLNEIKGMAFAGVGGDLQIVLTNPTGEIKHATRAANGSWTAFGDLHKVLGLDEPLISLDAAAVADEFQVAFVTADGQILHTVRHANGKWEPTDDRPGIPGTPSLVALTGSLS